MPDITDFAPPVYRSDADLRARQAELDERDKKLRAAISWSDIYSAAARGTFFGEAVLEAALPAHGVDPNYRLDQKELDRLSQGIDPKLRVGFAAATSLDHAEQLRAKYQLMTRDSQDLHDAGWTGTAASIVGSIADPVSLTAGLLTGGAGTAVNVTTKAARAAQAIRAAAIAGGTFAGIEVARKSIDPRVSTLDVLRAGTSGFGFGLGSAASQGGKYLTRALGAGGGGAAGSLAVDIPASFVDPDVTGRQILWNAGTQLAFGGLTAALHSNRNPALDSAARNLMKDTEFAAIADEARARGVSPIDLLNDDGKTYFKDQLDAGARTAEQFERVEPALESTPDELTPSEGGEPGTPPEAPAEPLQGRALRARQRLDAVREARSVVNDVRWEPSRRDELVEALRTSYDLGANQADRIVSGAIRDRRPNSFGSDARQAAADRALQNTQANSQAIATGEPVAGDHLDSGAAIDAIVRDALALANEAHLPSPVDQVEPGAVAVSRDSQGVSPAVQQTLEAEHGTGPAPAAEPTKGQPARIPDKFAEGKQPFGDRLNIPFDAVERVPQLDEAKATKGGFVPDEALSDAPMSWYDANYLAVEAAKDDPFTVYAMKQVDPAADTWVVVRRDKTQAELQATRGDVGRVYTKAEIEQRLENHMADLGIDSATDDAVEVASGAHRSFTFYERLPGEVRSMIESDPSLRRVFTVTDQPSKAGGWDAFSRMGPDAYMEAAQRFGKANMKRVLEVAHDSVDPEIKFLAALYENLPSKADRAAQVSMTPDELPVGSTFTIHGEKFTVELEGNGDWSYRVLKDDRSYPETPIDALSKIPVDRDSLTKPGGGGRPSVPRAVEDWADAGIADAVNQIRKSGIPRGPNTGATTLPGDIFHSARIVVYSAIKGGARTVGVIQRAVMRMLEAAKGLTSADVAKAKAAADGTIDAAMKAGAIPYQDKAPADPKAVAEKRVGDLDLSKVRNVPKSAFGKQLKIGDKVILTARFDMAGHVGQSPNQAMRDVGAMVLPDPIPRGETASAADANTYADNRANGFVGRMLGRNDKAYAQHIQQARAQNQTPLERGAFMEQVGRAVRRPGGEFSNDPAVNAAVDNARQLFRDVAELAKRHNVKGFDGFETDDGYLTRIGSREKIDAAEAKYGANNVRAIIRESYQRSNEWATGDKEAVANLVARAWLKNIGRTAEPDVMATMEMQDPTLIAAKVREILGDEVSDQQVRAVANALGRDPTNVGKISEAKQRIRLDETYGREVFDEQGNSLGNLSVEDLLENNAEVIAALYARRVVGAAAVSEVYSQVGRITGKQVSTIEGVKRVLREEAEKTKGYSKAAIDTDLSKIEIGLKLAAGIPLHETTTAVRVIRAIRNLNYTRLMAHPATGVRNAFEITGAMAELGPDVVAAQLPNIVDMFRRAENGDLSDAALRELAFFAGIGESWSARRPMPGLADDLAATTGAEELISKTTRAASAISLQGPSQTAIERVVGKSIIQKWTEVAKAGKKFSQRRRLGMGIQDEAQLDRIGDQLRRHATWSNDGLKIAELNLDNWSDQNAAREFVTAVQKQTFRLIQQNSPAAYAKWMTTEGGKTVAQMRTFTFGAWVGKTLYNVKMADAQAYIQWATTSVGAAASFVVGTYLRSLGRQDAEEYRRKNLQPDKIIKAGFAQAAFSSLLPMAIDTAAPIFGEDEIFSFARTTQLSNNILFGNPTLDWFESAWKGKNAVLGPISPRYSLSRDDVNNLANGLWVPRTVGVQGVIDQITRRLPKHSKVQEYER